MSNSYNPSPLMMGAAAYLVLFLPVVVAGALDRDEVRVEAMIQTFFNPEIIAAAWPIVLAGLLNTVLLSLIVVPLGLLGGLMLALLASVRHPLVRWPLMAWVDFFRAFPPLVLLILLFAGPAVRRPRAGRLRLRGHRLLPQHRRLLRRDLARRHRFRAGRPGRGRRARPASAACRP